MTRHLSIALLALFAASACTQPPGPGPASYPSTASDALPALDWQTWIEGREVFVELADPSDYYDTVTMELVAPEGQRIPAQSITREERIYRDRYGYGRPTVGIGGGTGRRGGVGVGVGMSVPLGGGPAPSDHRDRRIVGRFVVPDMYHYQRTAAAWGIEVELTSRRGETSRARIPAPLP